MISYPDPFANTRRLRMYRAAFLLLCLALVLLALIMLKNAYERQMQARDALDSTRSAEAMLPKVQPVKPVVMVDPRQRSYLAEIKTTVEKLSVDWIARIGSIEKAMGSDSALNGIRVGK
jgi:hypothetical protein